MTLHNVIAIMNDYSLINEEQLRRFRMDNPHLDDVDLMARLNMELARQLHHLDSQRYIVLAKEVDPLKCFASLRPTREQVRIALLRLLEMPCPNDIARRLISRKSHWLAVMRALQFLGVVSTNYGARQEFVDYLHELLPDNNFKIMATNLKGVESESPFNRMLPDWYERLSSPRTKYYWKISITFLECLSR